MNIKFKAFTLVEILVTMAISAVVMAFSYPIYPIQLYSGQSNLKITFQHLSLNPDQVTLQEYSKTQIGRRPQLFGDM